MQRFREYAPQLWFDVSTKISSSRKEMVWPSLYHDHLVPTREDFCRHIKSQLRRTFTESLHTRDLQQYQSVVRHKVWTHQRSYLKAESEKARGTLWQCSTSILNFALTPFYELSNEALVHSTARFWAHPSACPMHYTQKLTSRNMQILTNGEISY